MKNKKKYILIISIIIAVILLSVSLLIFTPKNNTQKKDDLEKIIKTYLDDQNITFKIIGENDESYSIIVESSDSKKSGEYKIIKETKKVSKVPSQITLFN